MKHKSIARQIIIHPLFWIILVSIIPTLPFFLTTSLIHTHDGLVHLPRLAEFYKALSDGQFPVRWAGDLNYHYGLPLFNFIYHLPYYVGSLFLFLGAGLVVAFKLSLALSFILSGIFMYMFAKIFFDDTDKALLVTILYQFAPFRIVELLVRGSYGEVYTYAFLPLVLYGIFLTIKKPSAFSIGIISLASALLIVSHNSVSLLFFGVSAFFALTFARTFKKIVLCALGMVLGLITSAYYWVPALLEHKYTYGDLYMQDLYKSHFAPFQDFFIPNLFNSQVLNIGAVNIHIGIFHTIAIILAAGSVIQYRFSNKQDKRIYLFSFVILVVSFFFMTEISRPIWDSGFNLIRQFQFPWRFLSLVVFASSLLGFTFFQIPAFRQKATLIGLIFFVVFSVSFYFKAQEGYDRVKESTYWDFALNTTYYGETDIIWSDGLQKKYPKNPVDFIAGDGKIQDYVRKSNTREYTVLANSDSTIVDHTHYFPGWRVFVDGAKTQIEFQDQNYRGQLTFKVPKGSHSVIAVFQESKTRLLSDVLSLVGLFITMILFLTLPIKHFNEKK